MFNNNKGRKITEKDLDEAKTIIDKFDLVIILYNNINNY